MGRRRPRYRVFCRFWRQCAFGIDGARYRVGHPSFLAAQRKPCPRCGGSVAASEVRVR